MAKKHKLSPEQDMAADPLKNVWVQANAGTGKTSVLVQRLLRILFRTPDCGTSGILCLTYTKAGAGEMRNRILKALRNWAMSSDDELSELLDGIAIHKNISESDIVHAREIFFKYIDNPDILKIKTIHGFCEEILHRFPLEAGVSPTWSLISGAPQRVLLQDTFQAMINTPTSDNRVYSAFAHLVGRVSETYVDELLGILSEQYKLFFQVQDIEKYRKYFIDTIEKYLNTERALVYDYDAVKLKNIIFNAETEQKSRKTPAKTLDELIKTTKQYIDKTIDFEEYKKLYLTSDGRPKKFASERDYLVAEQELVYAINQYNINKMIFDDTVALFDLSASFAMAYKRAKRDRNLLDFEDLILYTKKLFANPDTMGWVLSQLDLSLSHILVDEAQDTSPMQWDILRSLSGDFFTDGDTTQIPHSMFVVGDTKQSIYGFQGADPAAFTDSRDIISSQIKNNLRTIQEIPLVQSFRSTAPVLYAVDKFFSDETVIGISDFYNNSHKCFRENDTGAVELHKLVSKKESDTDRNEYLRTIAQRIKTIVDSGKYKSGDIMVLVQQRNQFVAPLVSELKKLNISVAGSDRIILPEFPMIRDLLNLVRWCLNPADDYSLCCVLKSPVFGLKEVDIFNLCKQKNDINLSRIRDEKNAALITVYEVLQNVFPDIYSSLSDIKIQSEHAAPYSFFSYVLNDGVKHNFISALGNQVIDPLEEFMTICLSYERTQPGTLYHFLKWFITGGSEVVRDMDSASGVRIVTVHGSKGLESPVVFLIDTVHMPKSDKIITIASGNAPVWLWVPRGDGSHAFANAASKQSDVQMAEYYRLLYVAMTRAKDELYIYGFTADKNPPINAWHTQLWRVFGADSYTEHIRITNDDIK